MKVDNMKEGIARTEAIVNPLSTPGTPPGIVMVGIVIGLTVAEVLATGIVMWAVITYCCIP